MSAIIPFDGGKLPAYLKNRDNLPNVNAEVVTAAAFPSISIKGKQFTISRDGLKTTLMKPDDPDEVAQKIEVAVLRANTGAKVFYAKRYVEGDQSPPDCFSRDGKAPDPSVANPQASNCQICKHAQWGSRISDDGESKGKACSDQVRLAVAMPDKLDDPYLLRVPPASIKNFKDAVRIAKQKNIPYNALVYRVGFDKDAASPELTFKPVGLLDDTGYAQVTDLYDGELVRTVVGLEGDVTPAAPAAAAKPAVETDELDAALAARAAKPTAQKPVAKPAPAAVQSDELDGVLAEPPAAAPAPAPARKPAAKAKPAPVAAEDGDALLSGLDDLLGGDTDD